MTETPRLYQPATTGTFDALWDIRDGRTFFSGPLYDCAPHQHGAPVFLAGLYGKFRLCLPGGDWQWCRTAIIPAGVVHALAVGGEPITVLYLEPTVAGLEALLPLLKNGQAQHGALVGNGGEIAFMRELYEQRYRSDWTADALQDLLEYAQRQSPGTVVDPRLRQALEYLHHHDDQLASLTAVVAQTGLSSSRFQHLFTEQIGVPFRRYRAWNRMRQALTHIVSGDNFTTTPRASLTQPTSAIISAKPSVRRPASACAIWPVYKLDCSTDDDTVVKTLFCLANTRSIFAQHSAIELFYCNFDSDAAYAKTLNQALLLASGTGVKKDVFEEQLGQPMDGAFLEQLAAFNGRLLAIGLMPTDPR